MNWFKSKTFWGALVTAAAPVIAAPNASDRVTAIAQGLGIVLAAVGIRSAVSKNGAGE